MKICKNFEKNIKKILDQKNKKAHTILIQTGNRLDEIKVTIVTCISNLGKTINVKVKLHRVPED